jgi:dTDP-4-amino-4,6-dideoxygalactose transaminase
MILTDDDRLRYYASLFLDKCYQREEGLRNPFFLAPNYQMTELQGAVALAQLTKVEDVVRRRNDLGRRLAAHLAAVPGIATQAVPPNSQHSYFMFLFRIDRAALSCTAEEFSAALEAEGVPNSARLITGKRPVYLYDIFQRRSAFPGTTYPLTSRTYARGDCPIAEAAFDDWIVTNVFEHYTGTDVDEIAHGIGKVAAHYAGAGTRASLHAEPAR